jgi:hypothetical protein
MLALLTRRTEYDTIGTGPASLSVELIGGIIVITYAIAAITVSTFGLVVAINQYRRHRTRPTIYHIMMAQYLWRPPERR